jgi:hypothetical protein
MPTTNGPKNKLQRQSGARELPIEPMEQENSPETETKGSSEKPKLLRQYRAISLSHEEDELPDVKLGNFMNKAKTGEFTVLQTLETKAETSFLADNSTFKINGIQIFAKFNGVEVFADDSPVFHQLRKIAERRHYIEHIDFLQAIRKLDKLTSRDERSKACQDIVNLYIKDGADYQINISSDERNTVMKSVRNGLDIKSFEIAIKKTLSEVIAGAMSASDKKDLEKARVEMVINELNDVIMKLTAQSIQYNPNGSRLITLGFLTSNDTRAKVYLKKSLEGAKETLKKIIDPENKFEPKDVLEKHLAMQSLCLDHLKLLIVNKTKKEGLVTIVKRIAEAIEAAMKVGIAMDISPGKRIHKTVLPRESYKFK